MFLVPQAPLDLEGTQGQLDHPENQVMAVLGPKESQGCQDHGDHQPLESQVHQDYQANQGREDHLDQKERMEQLVYQDHGVHQGLLGSLVQLEFLFRGNLDNRDLQEPQDPGVFLEKRVYQDSLVRMGRKGRQDMVLLAAQVREAFQALRVPWDHLAPLEWEKEVKMDFQDSQASKVTGVFQEKGGQLDHQDPKVLLGNEDGKA